MLRKFWYWLFPIKCNVDIGGSVLFTHPRGGEKNQVCNVLRRIDKNHKTFLVVQLETPFWDEHTVQMLQLEGVIWDNDGTIRMATGEEWLTFMKV